MVGVSRPPHMDPPVTQQKFCIAFLNWRKLTNSKQQLRTGLLLDGLECGLKVYNEMAKTLDNIDTSSSANAESIRQILLTSAKRDVQIIQALIS